MRNDEIQTSNIPVKLNTPLTDIANTPGDIAESDEALLRWYQGHPDDSTEAFASEGGRSLHKVSHRDLKRRLQSAQQRLVETHRVVEDLVDFSTSLTRDDERT